MTTYQLADRIAAKLIVTSGKSEYQIHKDRYRYGIEILLTTVVGVAAIAFTAVLLNMEREVLVYVIPFCLLRICIGGAHAETHTKCVSYFICIMLGVIIASGSVAALDAGYAQVTIFLVGCCNIGNVLMELKHIAKEERLQKTGYLGAALLSVFMISASIIWKADLLYMEILILALAVELISVRMKRRKKNETD